MKPVILNACDTYSIVALFTISLLMIGSASGRSSGPYVLEPSTIDGGGGVSSGGDYILAATIGQPDASYSAGGPYEILGGFWPSGPLCIVEFEDYARLAEHWRKSGSGLPADLDGNLIVDELDLKRFVDEWLLECPYRWPLR